MNELTIKTILLIEDEQIVKSEIMNKVIDELEKSLWDFNIMAIRATSYDEARVLISTDMDLDCVAATSDVMLDKQENQEIIDLMRCNLITPNKQDVMDMSMHYDIDISEVEAEIAVAVFEKMNQDKSQWLSV